MENIYNGYDVYVKTNVNDIIIAINSSAFITNYDEWTLIESNVQGDKGHHAQSNYFDNPLVDERGLYNYKLVDGKPVLRIDEDKTPEIEKLNARTEIAQLKSKLAATDYIGIKIGEGACTEDEYLEERAQRAAWRKRINELEGLI